MTANPISVDPSSADPVDSSEPSIENSTENSTENSLAASLFDRVSSWLIALLILVTVANAGLFILWYYDTFERIAVENGNNPDKVFKLNNTSGEKSLAQPTFGELTSLEVNVIIAEETLSLIQELSTQVATTVPSSGANVPNAGKDGTTGDGGEHGTTGRPSEPDVLPPWERWELRFDSTNRARYARQLDYFKIELAAIGGAPWVDYASQVATPNPTTRRGSASKEKRIYMTWKQGSLGRFDRQLLNAAGIPHQDRILMHFLTDELTETLTQLEDDNTERPRTEWQKTVFSLRAKGDGYEWHVTEQTFRE